MRQNIAEYLLSGIAMSHSVEWSEKAKQHLEEVVVARTKAACNPPNTEAAARIVTEELSLYPRRADAQPGEPIIGELPILDYGSLTTSTWMETLQSLQMLRPNYARQPTRPCDFRGGGFTPTAKFVVRGDE